MVDEVITKQELIDAQKDAQSLDDFINGGDEQIVVTRLLKEYPTLANAIRQIYEKGGKFYPTLAAANADIANIRTDVYVITGDNGAYYKLTAESTSLTKSPYDPLTQARNYADANKLDFKNLEYSYVNGNHVGANTKLYVGKGIAGASTIVTDVRYNAKLIPVNGISELYILNNVQDYASGNGFSIAFFDADPFIATANRITDARVLFTDVSSGLKYLKVTVPAGAKYLAFNTKFNAINIDYSINEGAFSSSYTAGYELINKINNIPVEQPDIRKIATEARYGTAVSGDIYDPAKLIVNKYVTTAGDLSASSEVQAWKSFSFPVSANETVYIKITAPLSFPFKMVYSSSTTTVSNAGGSYKGNVSLTPTDTENVYKFTVPSGLGIVAVFMNVELVTGTSPTMDLRSTLSIQKYLWSDAKVGVIEKVVDQLLGNKIIDSTAQRLAAQALSIASSATSRLKDAKVFAFGDSITQGTEGGYITYLDAAFGTAAINYGSSGAKANRMVDIVTAGQGLAKRDSATAGTVWPTKDFTNLKCVTMMIGTNEPYNSDVGLVADIPTDTVYDNLANPTAYFERFPNKMLTNIALCIEYIRWKAPKAEIHLITPPYLYGTVNGIAQTTWLIPHLEAVAKYYGVHLIYGTYESGISYKGMRGVDNIYSYDGTHFNELGNEVFGKFVAQKVLSFG